MRNSQMVQTYALTTIGMSQALREFRASETETPTSPPPVTHPDVETEPNTAPRREAIPEPDSTPGGHPGTACPIKK